MIDQGFQKLDVHLPTHELDVRVREMSLSFLKFELSKVESQILQSAKPISSNTVKGYCLNNRMKEFLLYCNLTDALSSETIAYLKILIETKSFIGKQQFVLLRNQYESLSQVVFKLALAAHRRHKTAHAFKQPIFPYFHSTPEEPIPNSVTHTL